MPSSTRLAVSVRLCFFPLILMTGNIKISASGRNEADRRILRVEVADERNDAPNSDGGAIVDRGEIIEFSRLLARCGCDYKL